MPLPCVQPRSWGCLPEAFLPGRKKHLLSLKTIALAIPLAQKTGLSTIDEVISTSPHYQSVPDFQRVQITGDYASGVGISWPFNFPMRLPPHLVLACPSRVPTVTDIHARCVEVVCAFQLYVCLISI